MIWFDAAAAIFTVLLFAAAWESEHRPARPSFQSLCPCGCRRPIDKHNPMRNRLASLIGRHL